MRNISQCNIRKIVFPIPSIAEQMEIVSILDYLLSTELSSKRTAEQTIVQIEQMKKAILARAFRGELGTNDPTDDTAIDLLKAVLGEEKANNDEAKPAKKRASVPAEIEGNLNTAMERNIVKLFYKADTTDIPIRQIMSISSKKFESYVKHLIEIDKMTRSWFNYEKSG